MHVVIALSGLVSHTKVLSSTLPTLASWMHSVSALWQLVVALDEVLYDNVNK